MSAPCTALRWRPAWASSPPTRGRRASPALSIDSKDPSR